MPSKTPKQHRAMEAAAHGGGTIGIPTAVAKDYVKADQKTLKAHIKWHFGGKGRGA